MRTLLPLVMFVVGAGTIAGGYALLAWLPARLAQRRIETRIAGLAAPFAEPDQHLVGCRLDVEVRRPVPEGSCSGTSRKELCKAY